MRYLIPVLVLLSGCATGRNAIPGPNGERVVEVDCPVASECLDDARKLCGGDYDLISQTQQSRYQNVAMIHCRNADNANGRPVWCTNDAQCPLDQVCKMGTGASGLCSPH